MNRDAEACAAYFRAHPACHRVLKKALGKYRSFGRAGGNILLRDATREECEAMRSLFGRSFTPPLKIGLAELEKAIQATAFQEAQLKEVLEIYFGETIRTRQEQRREREAQLEQLLAVAGREDTDPAALAWLEKLRDARRGERKILNRALEEDPEGACTAVQQVLRAARQIRDRGGIRMAVLSAAVTTDPHALDQGTTAGKLLVAMLADMAGVPVPENAEQREELCYRFGIFCDSISSTVTQLGLVLEEASGEHPAYRILRERREICTLTSASLIPIQGAGSPSGRVYLVENQMVFSQLCDHAERFHSPLICTSGQPSVACHRLLDMLARSGTQMYYSGDFDGMGLSIAAQMVERYPGQVRLWHMGEEDYRRSCSEKELPEQSRRILENGTVRANVPVSDAVRVRGRAGYQEMILEQLLADLTQPQA